jgi:hypothetical protein
MDDETSGKILTGIQTGKRTGRKFFKSVYKP